MKLINKQFNTEAVEAPAGGGSIAALMAKHGVQNSSDSMVATPIDITERKEESKPAEEAKQVEATSTESSAAAASESPKPTEEAKPTETHTEKVETPQPTWQEVLKQQQPDTVFKELGFDDKVVVLAKSLNGFDKIDFFSKLVDTWKSNGNVTEYLKELSTDYEKMPAEELMRHQLKLEYPKASPQQLEVLYNREIVKAYNLDSDDEDEVAEGKLLLEAKADKYRETFMAKQKDYLFPAAPETKQPEVDAQMEAAKQEFEAYKSHINDSSFTKGIVANKSITIGEGDETFNLPVEPNSLTEILFDSEKWANEFFIKEKQADGSIKSVPDVEKQMLVAAVTKYGKAVFTEYAKHVKSLGAKQVIDPIDNAKKPDNNQPSATEKSPTSVAEAMAKQGRLV